MSKQANKFSSNQKLRHVYAHIMRITIAFQRTLFHLLPSAAILIACTACHTNNSWLTKSTGQPYEVLLVDDIDSIIFKELSVQLHNLPQPEPTFDVSTTDKEHFKWNAKTARNIVVIKTDADNKTISKQVTNPHSLREGVRGWVPVIEYEHDTYAQPQIIITIKAPTAEMIKQKKDDIGQKIRQLLHNQEQKNEIMELQNNHAIKAEKVIKEMSDADMLIPIEMTHMKQGKNFLWLSDNNPKSMQNICIFKGNNVDSILKVNMKGETDSIYMTLCNQQQIPDTPTLIKGLWEMKGDAMGGPYILKKTDNVSVLAFIYAPDMKKRNKLKRLETAVLSIKNKN